MYLVEYIWYWK